MSYKSEFISNHYFSIISSKKLVPYANSKYSVKDSLYKPCINHESYKIQIVVKITTHSTHAEISSSSLK